MEDSNSKPNVPRTCKRCGQVRDRILAKTFADGSKYYTDLNGKKWLGTTGPCCTHKARKDYFEPVEHKESECRICGTKFVQKVSTQVYCSTGCSIKAVAKSVKKSKASKVGEE